MPSAIVSLRKIEKTNEDILYSYGAEGLSSKESAPVYQPKMELQAAKDSLAPAFNPGFFLIGLQIQTEDLANQKIFLDKTEIEENFQTRKQLDEEKKEALKKHAIKINSSATWDAIKNVATYFSYATSTVIGCSACINPTLSIILVGSGVAGLANKVLSDTGVWKSISSYFVKQEETQEKVAHYIEGSIFVVTAGLGLFNVVGGTLFGVETLLGNPSWKLVKDTGYYGSTIISLVSNYQEGKTRSDVYNSSSVLSSIEGKQIALSNNLKSTTTDMEETVKDNSNIAEKVHSFIESIIEGLKKITGR